MHGIMCPYIYTKGVGVHGVVSAYDYMVKTVIRGRTNAYGKYGRYKPISYTSIDIVGKLHKGVSYDYALHQGS